MWLVDFCLDCVRWQQQVLDVLLLLEILNILSDLGELSKLVSFVKFESYILLKTITIKKIYILIYSHLMY